MGKTREKPHGGRPREKPLCPRGKIIEQRLAQMNLSVESVAEVSGISAPTIYDIISGDTSDPRVSTLARLAEALDLPMSTLAVANQR